MSIRRCPARTILVVAPPIHDAVTYFTMYPYNFCWPVRTLRQQCPDGQWRPQTPAMAAGLTDHVWSLWEWLTFPVGQRE